MFREDNQNISKADKHAQILKELDEIKRYTAHTYKQVNDHMSELLNLLKKIEAQVVETDRQVDTIERFDKILNEIKSGIKNIERKL